MEFVFQGFQSGLPVWFYIMLFIGTTALSWWSYQSVTGVSPPYKYGLITLRSLVFFILITLLVNPFFKAETTYYEKPELLVIMDNSASTSIEKNEYKGTESYRNLLNELNFADSSRTGFIFFELDHNTLPSHPDSLSFKGDGTNLFNALEVVNNHQREVTAAVLISDGIFTQGRDPAFEAGGIDIPLYTIAVGDTTRQKDLVVKSVVSSSTGYVNTRHPVEVTVLNNGFAGQAFEVQIKKGNRVLDSQTVTPGSDISSHTLNFELELTEEGLQQYQIAIPSQADEWTQANNSQPFSIDVLDEKQRILSVAFEVHPDVKVVRSVLLGDENTQLFPRTWLGGSRFVEGPFNFDSDSLDLVIIQGFPVSGVPEALTRQVATILDNVPSMVVATPSGSFRALEQQTGHSLPLQQQKSASTGEVNMVAAVESSAHPIMELPQLNLQRMPPVSAPIQGIDATGGTVLFTSNFQGTETNQPLIAVNQTGNLRQAQVVGYGWYRAFQSAREQDREFVQQLFSNLVGWTATKPDDRLLDIKPAQTVFSGDQPIVLNAFLTNESGESEPEGDIEVTISGDEIENRNYSMNNMGNGQYQLQLSTLPEGVYSYEATARKGNRIIDSSKGEFSVSSSNIEFVDTRRNDPLLRQMAERSGGRFYSYNQVAEFWKDLEEDGLLSMEEKVRDNLFYPYQHSFWFIIVIAFLAAEWVIRKYLALP